MLASELITDTIPPLKTTDTAEKALNWMDEFKVRHLPVVNNTEYVGLISDSEILDLNTPEKSLKGLNLRLSRPYVMQTQHIYEVIKHIASLKLTLIPVLDENQNYIGIIPLSNLVRNFAQMAVIQEQGAVIVLELNVNDYSMAEIARIIESNDAKILSSCITSHINSTKLELTIKTNKTDLSGVLQTFNRYNYTVMASYQETGHSGDLQNRLDFFMTYLNV